MADSQSGADGTPAFNETGKYAKLAVRVRAAVYDWMIFILTSVVVISLAKSSNSEATAKAIGIIAGVLVVLYEPVMVWAKGGTLGHIACNLRVVDDSTLGNPSLLKATMRFAIKAVLGWYSFVTIMASRRLRAIHDVLTDSTVQIRNVDHAKAYDFAGETPDPHGKKPLSVMKCTLAIVIYSIISFIFLGLGAQLLETFHLVSNRCINNNQCSLGEHLIFTAIGLGWLASLIVIIGLGWRGRLFGFRAR